MYDFAKLDFLKQFARPHGTASSGPALDLRRRRHGGLVTSFARDHLDCFLASSVETVSSTDRPIPSGLFIRNACYRIALTPAFVSIGASFRISTSPMPIKSRKSC
jgi:hypothetical protein